MWWLEGVLNHIHQGGYVLLEAHVRQGMDGLLYLHFLNCWAV